MNRNDKGVLPINYSAYRSRAFNSRVRYLVLHYTAVDFQTSVNLLTSRASAHYLVPKPDDPSYLKAGFKDLQVFNLVDESQRAWHAGVSQWQRRSNLNDTSIGIEIVNLASDDNGVFTFPPYPEQQVKLLVQLTRNILQRHPDIGPTRVVAHSDIAPGRKSDPGPMFPWRVLHEAGVGAWYEEETRQKYLQQFRQSGLPDGKDLRQAFARYGYAISEDASPSVFTPVVRAFQMHFRAENYSGEVDEETAAILYALLERYSAELS